MVRPRVLVPLLAAATLLVGAGYLLVVVPRVFVRPCPSGPRTTAAAAAPRSLAPSTGPAAACAAVVCLRVSRSVLGVITFVVGLIVGCVTYSCYNWLADDENKEEDESGDAKKAGYVAIADDPEAGTNAGGEN